MDKNRIAKLLALTTGFIFLIAIPEMARPDTAAPHAPQTAQAGVQPARDPMNDFAGLNLTDEQKAAIDKIHRDIVTRKETVAKSEKLTQDQKDAMIQGYGRIEYSQVLKVLSPEQQKLVRQRLHARQTAEQEGQKQQPPH